MALSVLITQCLQRDFVEPVDAHEPLPNKLHVGREEAIRLMGRDPHYGPVAQVMRWARRQPQDRLAVLHIRDWHDDGDPLQREHIDMFGAHCIAGTPGAALVLGLDSLLDERPNEHVVDSLTLNDFEGTDLPSLMTALADRAGNEPLRVGVMGVWTEAKVSFLLYDLKTRCRVDALAACSALTASASRAQHFNALDQLRKILGVEVFDSVGEFAEWLVPDSVGGETPSAHGKFEVDLDVAGADLALSPDDRDVLSFLYRDSSKVTLRPLTGGFSGALVFRATSRDAVGQAQAPSVAKVGPRGLIGTERASFERVEAVLGNNAPSVRGYVDFENRAGIKYSYAAMGRGDIHTFKSLYEGGLAQKRVDEILRDVFEEILEPFHAAARFERLPLLEHYTFSPEWADATRARVAAVYGEGGEAPRLALPDGGDASNPAEFYKRFVPEHLGDTGEYHYVSTVHGDLNAANILVDGRDNVWLIDFFHTGPGHVLKDLLKLENDLLYILTPVPDEATLREAMVITRALAGVGDLAQPLPESLPGLASEGLKRAWATVRTLRSIGAGLCREDRNPLQASIALLRYAVHTLSFDESDALQKRWALGAGCLLSDRIMNVKERDRTLRVDWIDGDALGGEGRLGLTLCPGRKDRGRDLGEDLARIRGLGVKRLVGLLTEEELEWAGVPHIREAAEKAGLHYRLLPVPDQGAPGSEEAKTLSREINEALDAGEDVVIHCVGGLGRTGTVAACVAVDRGKSAEEAIRLVRAARGPRAVESEAQERFVGEYAKARTS
jgi:protein-tyrosine phosphatase/nicotinamidase-related amidase